MVILFIVRFQRQGVGPGGVGNEVCFQRLLGRAGEIVQIQFPGYVAVRFQQHGHIAAIGGDLLLINAADGNAGTDVHLLVVFFRDLRVAGTECLRKIFSTLLDIQIISKIIPGANSVYNRQPLYQGFPLFLRVVFS